MNPFPLYHNTNWINNSTFSQLYADVLSLCFGMINGNSIKIDNNAIN